MGSLLSSRPSSPPTKEMPPTPPLESTPSKTFAHQDKLPKLPIPPIEDTCRRYLSALVALQDEAEHEATKQAVEKFLANEGPAL